MEEVLLGIDEDFGMPLEQEEEVLEQEMVDGVIPADALAALDDAENKILTLLEKASEMAEELSRMQPEESESKLTTLAQDYLELCKAIRDGICEQLPSLDGAPPNINNSPKYGIAQRARIAEVEQELLEQQLQDVHKAVAEGRL